MIVPGTSIALARIPLAQIVVTEHQRRYPERVLHYVALLSDPQHADHDPGFVHLAPCGHRDDGTPLYTIRDGHHRYIAHILTGRTHVLALIFIEPQWPQQPCSGLELATLTVPPVS